MKVGAYMTRLAPGSTQQEKQITKSWDFFHSRPFCRFIFKNLWGLYGGDLNGFLPIFCKSYFKKLTPRTVDQLSQKLPGLARLRYAHPTAVPQS